MRSTLLLFYTVLFLNFSTKAQNFTIKEGMSISDVLSVTDIYRYPQFVAGVAYFADGKSSRGLLNYNMIIGEIQFINPAGDTLSLGQEDLLKYVTMQKDTFYFNKGYHLLVAKNPEFMLVKKTFYRDAHQKIGGYGMASSASSISSISSITTSDRTYNLKLNEQIILTKYSQFSFVDKNGIYYPADKKSILKIVTNKKSVSDYLQKNNVRFNNEADLAGLTNYIKTL